MEFSMLSQDCIKIKGKHAAIIIDPSKKEGNLKAAGDAIILLNEKGNAYSKVEGQRVVIKGPGEYEFLGVKISSIKVNHDLIYQVQIDGIEILLAATSGIDKFKEKLKEYPIVLLFANSKIDQSLITALEPKIALFYGEMAKDAVALFDKNVPDSGNGNIKPVSKFQVKAESLPEETQTVLLEQ